MAPYSLLASRYKKAQTAFLLSCLILIYNLLLTTNIYADIKDKRISVFVSIIPEVYFVQKIGGNRVDVQALVQPGQSPATYAATPKQMANLAQADIYFKIGVPFENSFIPKIKRSLPNLFIQDLQENISLLKLKAHEHDNHTEDKHYDNLDPHTWLDPQLVIHHAKIITESLSYIDPDAKELYTRNFQKFKTELEQLSLTLHKQLKPYNGKSIYVLHPAYGYFCNAYNLIQKAVAIDGKNPGAKHLASLIKNARKDQVKAIFIQPQFSSRSAKAIAQAIGAEIVHFDPLALDYPANLLKMAQEFIKAHSINPKE